MHPVSAWPRKHVPLKPTASVRVPGNKRQGVEWEGWTGLDAETPEDTFILRTMDELRQILKTQR